MNKFLIKKLEKTTIERWVKRVADQNCSCFDNSYHCDEMIDVLNKFKLAKRSKPSYDWQPEEGQWFRIWFQESNLTIQIDSYFADGEYYQKMEEIYLEEYTIPADLLRFYHNMLGRRMSCPEMLWAVMEVIDEAAQKIFDKNIVDAYLSQGVLNWTKPNNS